MARLSELVTDAVQGIVTRKPRIRERGYHASSTGKCIRSVVVGRYLDKPLHEFPVETQSIFHMGHTVDKWFKDSFERTVREGNVRILAPFQTVSFGNRHFAGVYGEGDVTLLDFDTKTMHWIDCKTCGHDQFYNKQSRGASSMNVLQVGTYMGSKQVQQILQSLGWDKVKGYLVYIDKENLNHVTIKADATCIEDARGYWELVSQVDEVYRNTGELPLALPQEDWECGYCNLHPGLPAVFYKNKTAIKNARAHMRITNRLNCEDNGKEIFLSKMEGGNKHG